jgi:hypothetical protein
VGDAGPFRYRPDILEQLLRHGVRPTDRTRPELVHEFVSDLYRHELRTLRDHLLAKEFPKREYFGRVVEVRQRYRIIAQRPRDWVS